MQSVHFLRWPWCAEISSMLSSHLRDFTCCFCILVTAPSPPGLLKYLFDLLSSFQLASLCYPPSSVTTLTIFCSSCLLMTRAR